MLSPPQLVQPQVRCMHDQTSCGKHLASVAWRLQESLSTLRSDQTTIIVAHRLSTVMDADIIIVMQVAHAARQLASIS